MEQEVTDVMRKNFYDRFNELIAVKGPNTQILSKELYLNIIQEVKGAKNKQRNKTPKDYKRMSRYDIITTEEGEEKLIVPLSISNSIKYYVHVDEIFQILHDSHKDHKGRNRMGRELNLKYKNITREMIIMYINQCAVCKLTKNFKKSSAAVICDKSLKFTRNIDSRCQVDVMDMTLESDDQFKFILIYQDLLTKFIQIRQLNSKEPEEVANVLLEIMSTIGAPCILQSENGRQFSKDVVTKLRGIWPLLEMVYGECLQPQEQGQNENFQVKLIIQNMLLSWIKTNGWAKWSNGLRFVQLTYNETYDTGLNCNPYEAMFGEKIKIGLRGFIPTIPSRKCYSEEDLHVYLQNTNTNTIEPKDVSEVQDDNTNYKPTESPVCSEEKLEYTPQIKFEKNKYSGSDEDVEESYIEEDSKQISYNLFDVKSKSFRVSPEHNHDLTNIDIKQEEENEPQPKKNKQE